MSREEIDKKIVTDKQSVEKADKQSASDKQLVEGQLIDQDVTDLEGSAFAEVDTLLETDDELLSEATDVEEVVAVDETIEFKKADDFETIDEKNKPIVTSKYIILTLISIVVISIVVGIYSGLLGDSKEELARADEAVESLFMDQQREFLKPDITESDFSEAMEAINELSNKNQTLYKETYQDAKVMFDAIKGLNEIFEGNQLMIQGDQVLPIDQLLVQSTVTKNLLDENQAAFELIQNQQLNEQLSDKIASLYQYAGEVVNYTDNAQLSIKNLPKSIANRSQLLDIINAIQAVELQLTEYTNQPKAVALYEELQSYANKVGDIIVDGLEVEDYDSNFWDEVYWTDTLVYYFEGPQVMDQKLIALTFDDGPNEEYTTQLLDILNKHDVKATFFVMGAYVDEFPDVARRIVEEGHTIGNHTYNHPDLSTVSDEEVLKQFNWTQDSIYDVTGVWATTYRMPFGSGGKRVVDLMEDMTSILWNIDSMDWHYQDTSLTYNHIMENLQQHSLLLMHDTHQATPDVIDLLIPVLKEQGYQFVSPTEVGFDLRYYAH